MGFIATLLCECIVVCFKLFCLSMLLLQDRVCVSDLEVGRGTTKHNTRPLTTLQ